VRGLVLILGDVEGSSEIKCVNLYSVYIRVWLRLVRGTTGKYSIHVAVI
jgi:hypothetical protein